MGSRVCFKVIAEVFMDSEENLAVRLVISYYMSTFNREKEALDSKISINRNFGNASKSFDGFVRHFDRIFSVGSFPAG